MIDLYQPIFDDTYSTILKVLEVRSQKPGFSIEQIKCELESFYKYDGLDYDGRGETKQAEIDGTISAYEVFISNRESKGQSVS